MPTTIRIRDESTSGTPLGEAVIELLTDRVDVRELIRSRAYQEVKDYNARGGEEFRGLVRPTDAETTLNGYRLRKPRQIDWKRQFDRAIEAFDQGHILLLVDDRQVEDLDAQLVVSPSTTVTFLRLMPLVGG